MAHRIPTPPLVSGLLRSSLLPPPRTPLDVTADATFALWVQQPETDLRTLDEFAADGGLPLKPIPPENIDIGSGQLYRMLAPTSTAFISIPPPDSGDYFKR